MPAGSLENERKFSQLTDTLSKKRLNTLPETIERVMGVKWNAASISTEELFLRLSVKFPTHRMENENCVDAEERIASQIPGRDFDIEKELDGEFEDEGEEDLEIINEDEVDDLFEKVLKMIEVEEDESEILKAEEDAKEWSEKRKDNPNLMDICD
jgi:hypothetical protein